MRTSFKNENEFKKWFCSNLESAGMSVTYIESHGTEVGIPDSFIQGFGYDCWIEFKNGPLIFRPGQQNWHKMYYLKHQCKQSVLVAHAGSKGVWLYQSNCEKPACLKLEDADVHLLPGILKFLCLDSKTKAADLRTFLVDKVNEAFEMFPELDWDPDIIVGINEPFSYINFLNRKVELLRIILDMINQQEF